MLVRLVEITRAFLNGFSSIRHIIIHRKTENRLVVVLKRILII